ncbi:hypothetical protein Tco_1244497, partial [Tanacetum coccineum]
VFEVPNKLPPARSHEHKIPLMPGTQPVNIRPYRHPPMQNDAIGAMIKELLESGLNKHTIKDKFPIPVIKDLIDELGGAVIFSKLDLRSLEDHVEHLRAVLSKMRDHSLYAKESKGMFGTTHMEYLGHVISAEGVATDSSKVQAMQTWPIPTTLKQPRGFLSLTGYYRRFIKDFASR